MNPFEMVVLIVGIVMIASVLKARYGVTKDRHGNEIVSRPDPEAGRMKDEIAQLKERIAVLERLATDNNGALALDREIEKLRQG
ncbi:MAG: hypothetical protein ABI898_09080 [Sphingomonadales bacterium]